MVHKGTFEAMTAFCIEAYSWPHLNVLFTSAKKVKPAPTHTCKYVHVCVRLSSVCLYCGCQEPSLTANLKTVLHELITVTH